MTCSCYTPRAQAAPPKEPEDKNIKNEELKTIALPIYFHLLNSFEMRAFQLDMSVWVTCDHIQLVIMPEINRIWKTAGIQFIYTGCGYHTDEPTSEQQEALETLENADRADDEIDEDSNTQRREAIKTLSLGVGIAQDAAMNVYVIPYMGSTRQGNAIGGNTSVMVGNWTNKPSQGGTPQRTLLVEAGSFRIGSLGRTIAHELGHCLNLNHPKRSSTVTGNLMGGRQPGYDLEDSQITKSRARATEIKQRLSQFNNMTLINSIGLGFGIPN